MGLRLVAAPWDTVRDIVVIHWDTDSRHMMGVLTSFDFDTSLEIDRMWFILLKLITDFILN